MKTLVLIFTTLLSINSFAQALSERSTVSTPASGDKFYILDASDSGALKAITWSAFFTNPTVSGTLDVDAIESSSTDTDLTLTGNGTGGVLANDAFTAVGNTTFIGSAPVRISQGSAMSHNLIYVNDYFSPTLTARNTDMVTVGYTTYDGSTYGFAAREFVSTAPSASCSTGAGDLPGRYKVSVSKDGDSTGAGAYIELEGCDDDIEIKNSSSEGITVQADGDVVMDGGLSIDVGEITSGTYTPTLTDVTNIDSTTAYELQYLRVGATVTVSGKIDIDATSAAASEVGVSLPVASNFASDGQCAGSLHGEDGDDGWIKGDATNDRCSINIVHNGTASQTYWFSFTYQVI